LATTSSGRCRFLFERFIGDSSQPLGPRKSLIRGGPVQRTPVIHSGAAQSQMRAECSHRRPSSDRQQARQRGSRRKKSSFESSLECSHSWREVHSSFRQQLRKCSAPSSRFICRRLKAGLTKRVARKATQKATHSAPKAAQKASQHPTAWVRNASFDSLVTPQTQRGCAARCEQAQPRAILHSGRRGFAIPGRRPGIQESQAAQPPRTGAAGPLYAHEAKQPASRQAAGLLSAVGGEGFEPP
jgi:hypothetical protein